MAYKRNQNIVDKEHGVFRVLDICFDQDATDGEIEEVMSEVFRMTLIPPALMTCKALAQYIMVPSYVLERMKAMPVGSSFEFDGLKITRWSKNTYNGMIL